MTIQLKKVALSQDQLQYSTESHSLQSQVGVISSDYYHAAGVCGPVEQVLADAQVPRRVELEPAHVSRTRPHIGHLRGVDSAGHVRDPAPGRSLGQGRVGTGPDQPGEAHRGDPDRQRAAHPEQLGADVGLEFALEEPRRQQHPLEGLDVAGAGPLVALAAVEVLPGEERRAPAGPPTQIVDGLVLDGGVTHGSQPYVCPRLHGNWQRRAPIWALRAANSRGRGGGRVCESAEHASEQGQGLGPGPLGGGLVVRVRVRPGVGVVGSGQYVDGDPIAEAGDGLDERLHAGHAHDANDQSTELRGSFRRSQCDAGLSCSGRHVENAPASCVFPSCYGFFLVGTQRKASRERCC